MKTSEALAHYDNNKSALARALHIDTSSIYDWKEYPPDMRQLQLERITDGELKAEPECRARVLGMPLQRANDRKEEPKAGE
jgi:hypothetical protein